MKIIPILSLLLTALAIPANAQTGNLVDLVWEADTYTPSFYRGHSEVVTGSRVKVVALPSFRANGRPIAEGELEFEWFKDGRKLNNASGLGKNSINYTATGGGDAVDVVVKSKDGSLRTQARINIPVRAPRVLLYENDLAVGTRYQEAITGTYRLLKPEISLLAEPFFFSLDRAPDRRLNFIWRVDGQRVVTDSNNQQLITIIAPEIRHTPDLTPVGGEHRIEISVSNPAIALQTARQNLIISTQPEFNF